MLAFHDRDSAASLLRRRRFACFLDLFERALQARGAKESAAGDPVRILDVGGTQPFWQGIGLADRDDCHVTLLNLFDHQTNNQRFTSAVGDGRDLAHFADGEFDIVFSSSGIECVGGLPEQMQLAREIRRVGRCYYVTTPNLYFPIEPHFQFPCFQFLPMSVRRNLVRNFALGSYRRAKHEAEASEWVSEIRLLTRRQLSTLFPEAHITIERQWGWSKSFTAVYAPPVPESHEKLFNPEPTATAGAMLKGPVSSAMGRHRPRWLAQPFEPAQAQRQE